MILITGATGQLGRLVIESLRNTVPAGAIVAAVRNLDKARDLEKSGVVLRQADYDRPELWPAALGNVNKVLLISSNEVGKRAAQHRAVIEAVRKSGSVTLLAYTSILHAERSPIGLAAEHRETEEMIRRSGVPFVLLRNGWYTENYAGNAAAAVARGALYGAAGQGRISSAARRDFAEAAARVMASPERAKEVLELAGDTSYTLAELAVEISRVSGKPVRYVDMSESDYKAFLLKAGLPEGLAAALANADAGVARGALHDESHELSSLIGRKTTPLSEVVSRALSHVGEGI